MLEPTILPVLFSGALDQKKDYKTQLPGQFLLLQNAVRRKGNRWEKRNGFASVASPGLPQAFSHLAPLNNTLFGFSAGSAFKYSPTGNTWTQHLADSHALCPLVDFNNAQLVPALGCSGFPDIAYANGYYGLTYADTVSSFLAPVIYDAATNSIVQYLPEVPGNNPIRVCAVGNYICFALYNAGTTTLTFVAFNTATLTASAPVTVSAAVTSSDLDIENFDGTAAAFAYIHNTEVTVGYFIPSINALGTGSNGYAAPITTAFGDGDTKAGINVACTSRAVYVSIYDVITGAVKILGCSVNFVNTTSGTIETPAVVGSGVRNLTITATRGVSVDTVDVVYEYSPGSSTTISAVLVEVHHGSLTWNAGVGPFAITAGTSIGTGYGLGSRLANVSGVLYFMAVTDTPDQASTFLMRLNNPVPDVYARFMSNVGGGFTKNPGNIFASSWKLTNGQFRLPRFNVGYGGKYTTALIRTDQFTFDGGVTNPFNYRQSIHRYDMDLSGTSHAVHCELGDSLALAGGGVVSTIDPMYASESNFHLFPEYAAFTATGGVGTLVGGTYTCQVIYEYIDGAGNVQRSAPSAPSTLTGVAPNATMTVGGPLLPLTSKLGGTGLRNIVRVVVYCSQAGVPGVLYRVAVATNQSSIPTSYAASTWTAVISAEPDGNAEILYTVGGQLENIAPPAARCATVHKNRVWLGGLETDEVAFSKEFETGTGVSFSDIFRIPVESSHGRVFAVAGMDSYVILFKRNRIYFLTGEGPNTAGANWDYTEPTRLPHDIGTQYPNSVALLPNGLIFKSDKGWFLLDRGLQVKYIGHNVSDHNSLTPTAAVIIKDENEVRFFHSDGVCLVYNYLFNQWSTFANYAAVSAAITLDGTIYHSTAGGLVNKETPGLYQDNGAQMNLAIETSWLAIAKINGFQRIYGIEILADYISRHHLKLSLAYDDSPSYTQVSSTDTNQFTVTNGTLRILLAPTQQKCSAIKLRLEDVDDLTGGGGQSFRPNAITVKVGRKKGLNKLSQGNKVS